MPTYLSPGVYMEEVSSGSKPIEGVGTAVAGFVGFAAKGPAHEPTLVTNWTQYTATFGDFIEGSYLAHAVYGYFLNGGGAAYVVRVGGDDDAAVAASAELPVSGRRVEEAPGRAGTRSRARWRRDHRRGCRRIGARGRHVQVDRASTGKATILRESKN